MFWKPSSHVHSESLSLTGINGVVVTWVVAIRVGDLPKLDPPGVRFPLNAFMSAIHLSCAFLLLFALLKD
jgi:hypothetical protein